MSTVFVRRPSGNIAPTLLVEGLLFLFVLAFESYRSFAAVPLPDGDQLVYYPLSLEVANTGLLRHQFYSPITDQFPAPMNWHGWLQPWLFGHVMRLFGSDFRSALLVEALFIVAGLALFFASLKSPAKASPLLVALQGMIVATALSAAKGRPEVLAGVILLAWHAARPRIHNQGSKYLVDGVALGLLGSTHPTAALLFSLFLLVYATACPPLLVSVSRWIAANALAAVIVAVGGEVMVPGGLFSWLTGLLGHAAVVSGRQPSFVGAFWYLLFAPDRFMHGLIVVLVPFFVVIWLVRNGRTSMASMAALAISIFAAWHFGVRLPPTSYNLMVFVPLAMLLLMQLSAPRPPASLAAPLPGLARSIVLAALAMAALSLPMQVATTGFSGYFGVSRLEFLALMDRISNSPARITIDPAFMVAAVPFQKWPTMSIRYQKGDHEGTTCSPDRVIITKQANTGLVAPQPIKGCAISAQTFTSVRVVLFGRDLVLIPKAYQYAVFGVDPAK
jgi:hypothetical protein